MANSSATVDEIRELIKETRIDMKEFNANMEQFRANMEQFRANTDQFRANMDQKLKQFHVGMEELRASQKETDRQLQETDKQLRKTDSQFNTQWGRLVESLVKGNLLTLLQARGIEVRQTHPNPEVSFVRDDGSIQHKEFDIVVVNGSEVVAVEVKTTLTPDKVSYFLSAMEQFKRYFPDYRHKRVYGAVAYLKSEAEAKRYAEKQGLFVIRATGDSASIVNAEDFRPKEFPSEGAA